jgi:hypothetical protein
MSWADAWLLLAARRVHQHTAVHDGDGRHLINSLGLAVVIKDLRRNTQCFLRGHSDVITCLALSNDGSRLESGQLCKSRGNNSPMTSGTSRARRQWSCVSTPVAAGSARSGSWTKKSLGCDWTSQELSSLKAIPPPRSLCSCSIQEIRYHRALCSLIENDVHIGEARVDHQMVHEPSELVRDELVTKASCTVCNYLLRWRLAHRRLTLRQCLRCCHFALKSSLASSCPVFCRRPLRS